MGAERLNGRIAALLLLSLGGCGGAGRTEAPPPRYMIPSTIEPTIKRMPSTVVARVSTVAPARAPNAVWLLDPPNAAAMSPPLPC